MKIFKKIAAFMTSAILTIGVFTCSLIGMTASAEGLVDSGSCGDKGENLLWTLDANGKLTISGTGDMADDTSAPWSTYIFTITSVEIEDGVTSIGDYAFNNLLSMESVSIPDSVTDIGSSAFFDCQALTSIDIPDSVTKIGTSAFYDCYSLTEVEVPENVKEIGFGAFQNCEKLKNITFYNPDCVIYDYNATISNSTEYSEDFTTSTVIYDGTITGYADSTAIKYAEKYGYKWAIIDSTTPSVKLGDVNNDNSVDASDASLVLVEYSALQTGKESTLTATEKIAADVIGDGSIDASDASEILRYYAESSTGKTPVWNN